MNWVTLFLVVVNVGLVFVQLVLVGYALQARAAMLFETERARLMRDAYEILTHRTRARVEPTPSGPINISEPARFNSVAELDEALGPSVKMPAEWAGPERRRGRFGIPPQSGERRVGAPRQDWPDQLDVLTRDG